MVLEGKACGGGWMANVDLADFRCKDEFGGRVAAVDCRLTDRVACSVLTKSAGVACAVSSACISRA